MPLSNKKNNLWILSQDKKQLVSCIRIQVVKNLGASIDPNYVIDGICPKNKYQTTTVHLGYFFQLENAIREMNQIQKTILERKKTYFISKCDTAAYSESDSEEKTDKSFNTYYQMKQNCIGMTSMASKMASKDTASLLTIVGIMERKDNFIALFEDSKTGNYRLPSVSQQGLENTETMIIRAFYQQTNHQVTLTNCLGYIKEVVDNKLQNVLIYVGRVIVYSTGDSKVVWVSKEQALTYFTNLITTSNPVTNPEIERDLLALKQYIKRNS